MYEYIIIIIIIIIIITLFVWTNCIYFVLLYIMCKGYIVFSHMPAHGHIRILQTLDRMSNRLHG